MDLQSNLYMGTELPFLYQITNVILSSLRNLISHDSVAVSLIITSIVSKPEKFNKNYKHAIFPDWLNALPRYISSRHSYKRFHLSERTFHYQNNETSSSNRILFTIRPKKTAPCGCTKQQVLFGLGVSPQRNHQENSHVKLRLRRIQHNYV